MTEQTQSIEEVTNKERNMAEILELANHSCLIRAYVESYQRNHISWEFMCERLVICLADQNKNYFDLVAEANSRAAAPLMVPNINSDRFN